jgi:hypothetical protein
MGSQLNCKGAVDSYKHSLLVSKFPCKSDVNQWNGLQSLLVTSGLVQPYNGVQAFRARHCHFWTSSRFTGEILEVLLMSLWYSAPFLQKLNMLFKRQTRDAYFPNVISASLCAPEGLITLHVTTRAENWPSQSPVLCTAVGPSATGRQPYLKSFLRTSSAGVCRWRFMSAKNDVNTEIYKIKCRSVGCRYRYV